MSSSHRARTGCTGWKLRVSLQPNLRSSSTRVLPACSRARATCARRASISSPSTSTMKRGNAPKSSASSRSPSPTARTCLRLSRRSGACPPQRRIARTWMKVRRFPCSSRFRFRTLSATRVPCSRLSSIRGKQMSSSRRFLCTSRRMPQAKRRRCARERCASSIQSPAAEPRSTRRSCGD